MKKITVLGLLLCTWIGGIFADEIDTISQSMPSDTVVHDRYTFSDFFDALEIPTTFGAAITPNGIESAGFNTCFRLGWRHHRRYGAFAFISYDTHSANYESLYLKDGRNICSGMVWYSEIGMAAGYRVPLVKDIHAFYNNPYDAPVNIYCAFQPEVTLAEVPIVSSYTDLDHTGEQLYQTTMEMTVVPSLRFYAGVEWFVLPRLSLFAEVSYIQHLMPTILEQAAMDKGMIKNPSGPITCGIGLSMFF